MARDSESNPFSTWKAFTPSYTGSGTRDLSSFLNSVFGLAMIEIPLSGGFCLASYVVDVVERDIDTALLGDSDNPARHVGRNLLILEFAMADVSLRNTKFIGKPSLGKTQAFANGLQVVFHF